MEAKPKNWANAGILFALLAVFIPLVFDNNTITANIFSVLLLISSFCYGVSIGINRSN